MPDCARVAFFTQELPAHPPASVLRGPQRCALADVVIVHDLTLLHNEEALVADPEIVLQLFHIVALGKKLVGAAHWQEVGGKPASLRTDWFIMHEPAIGGKADFRVTRAF